MRRKLLAELRAMPKFIYVLAVITLLGLGVGAYRMIVGLGATTNLSKDFPWGIWISFDLSTVALAGGAFALATLSATSSVRPATARKTNCPISR